MLTYLFFCMISSKIREQQPQNAKRLIFLRKEARTPERARDRDPGVIRRSRRAADDSSRIICCSDVVLSIRARAQKRERDSARFLGIPAATKHIGKNERGNRRHRYRYRRNICGDDERVNLRDQSKVPRHRHPLVRHAHLEKARLARRYRFRPEQERIEETFARVEARTQRRFRHGQER